MSMFPVQQTLPLLLVLFLFSQHAIRVQSFLNIHQKPASLFVLCQSRVGQNKVIRKCINTKANQLNKRNFQKQHTSTKLFSSKTDVTESPIPMTLLAGFLGSGKTTTLQNVLTNNNDLKIGVIVNDVASVNIDQKLISNNSGGNGANATLEGDDVVELQNGCACCSLSDELLTSVEKLTGNGSRNLDAIVVELSGVADPTSVKKNWNSAMYVDHPVTKLAEIKNVVTLVDASTFGTDWMSWDTSRERDGWVDPDDVCATEKNVAELLAEQVEAADVLVINKIDLAGTDQSKTAVGVARNLNVDAKLFEVEFGKISTEQILIDGGDEEDDDISDCNDPECADSSHPHTHDHDHESSNCSDFDCADASPSYEASSDCSDPSCTDTSHSHDHESVDCTAPGCTDTSHSHSHDHASTSTANLGISNFVYKSDRPFNAIRLMALLHTWPVPIKDTLDLEQLSEFGKEDNGDDKNKPPRSPFGGVLRSKGFCWTAPTKWEGPAADVWRHDTAMYWSHAGKHFSMSAAGNWWGCISREKMKAYFESNMKEYERILKEDWASEEWGDRRQEIVFIGARIVEKEIREALDRCLCTEEEVESYRQELKQLMGT